VFPLPVDRRGGMAADENLKIATTIRAVPGNGDLI
jgi:hypothetical protein